MADEKELRGAEKDDGEWEERGCGQTARDVIKGTSIVIIVALAALLLHNMPL